MQFTTGYKRLILGRVFNGSATHQNVGIDVSNVTFMTFVVSGCNRIYVILGTNSSDMFVDYYRFVVTATTARIRYVSDQCF